MFIKRPDIIYPLFADVKSIPGIGQKTANAIFSKIGDRVIDILFHFPTSIIDRRFTNNLTNSPINSIITTEATVIKHFPNKYNKKSPYKIIVENLHDEIDLIFFNYREDYLHQLLPINSKVIISGKINFYNNKYQITHPDYVLPHNRKDELPLFEPNYPLVNGLTLKILRKSILYSLKQMPMNLPEWIPESIVKSYNWPSFNEALVMVHLPKDKYGSIEFNNSRQRLAFDELFVNQIAVSILKNNRRSTRTKSKTINGTNLNKFISSLEFQLTKSQIRSINEITEDMKKPYPMSRMLQGDVGCGKTIVAITSILNIFESGGQAALMTPTDVLSKQHYNTISILLKSFNLKHCLLTNKISNSEKLKNLSLIKNGEVDLIIGTHSLISENVVFKNLKLVIIDEQHKFGVSQRIELLSKGENIDLLLISATPIPRSLYMTVYGDLDISIIDEMPKNRKQIITRALPNTRTDEIIKSMKKALINGEKVYWICPLLEESEILDVEAAQDRHKSLCKIFHSYNPELAHGKLIPSEREKAINNFLSGKSKILIATTVIEVGVDIPDATIIIIENAERFGLSQLHQLRGRVGRGKKQSYCLLIYKPPLNDIAKERLHSIKMSNNGFFIAEKDLKLRGAGEILGQKQSGEFQFKLNITKDYLDLIDIAKFQSENLNIKKNIPEEINILLSIFSKEESVKAITNI